MTIKNVGLLVVLVACAGFILSLRAENPQDPKSVEGLTVVDSKGVKVGNVLGFGTNHLDQVAPGLYPVVGLRVKGRLVLLSATTFGFTSFAGGPVADAGAGGAAGGNFTYFFPAANCAGAPFVARDLTNLPAMVPITYIISSFNFFDPNSTTNDAGRLYISDGPYQPGGIAFQSYNKFTPSGNCVNDPGVSPGTQLKLFFDLNTEFTPPFSVHSNTD